LIPCPVIGFSIAISLLTRQINNLASADNGLYKYSPMRVTEITIIDMGRYIFLYLFTKCVKTVFFV
jgi:hypothetical protein